ncbi:MAG: dephospho-CoA kinase [Inhella sp.]|jgi:dephospho-CoA kinase|uniref:dephospho-CoA kinase n=1 Tax=Inhella sp. TaxID=1921806 RepID=UPI0022BDE808|nr:dephospho-CoA kinase [Inhella sp.]MCZ8234728.1 dephospho-CoA kinase [Inhella sp.]
MRLGLTGGIGSGKSTAARVLAELGWRVVDTDAIARALTAPGGTALPALQARFGSAVFNEHGELDRSALRQQVFTDAQAKADLEALLHPLILREALAQAEGHEDVVFDVPLLVESGHWRQRVDAILVVDCDAEVQAQRVAQRPGWTLAQARAVMATQASREARRAVADVVVDNSTPTLAEFEAAVRLASARWRPPVKESSA